MMLSNPEVRGDSNAACPYTHLSNLFHLDPNTNLREEKGRAISASLTGEAVGVGAGSGRLVLH